MSETMDAHYPRATWRLIVEEHAREGADNMALDEALMVAVAAGESPPTLRFYRWAPPCLSLGKRQPLDGIDLAACARDAVQVVRRATGGWAILHTDELTYSIAVRPDDPRAEGAILDAYRKLSQGLVAGLRRMGVPAEMNPVTAGGTHNASAACFEVPSAYEITARGRKLIGSAQVRPNGHVLQHGSLPLVGEISRVARYLTFERDDERAALARHLSERAATLAELAGRETRFDEAAQALREGFAQTLNLRFEPGEPTEAERRVAAAKRAEKIVALGVPAGS